MGEHIRLSINEFVFCSMNSLVASFLIQKKECRLPQIGSFRIKRIPASTNNGSILPPEEHIMFNSGNETPSPELIRYISRKKNIDHTVAERELNDSCDNWANLLKRGEEIKLGTVGTLYQHQDNILFQPEQLNFFKPIETGVLKQEPATVPVLTEISIGKPETGNISEEVLFEETVDDRSYWGMWALILVAIISVTLFFHFFDQGFSIRSVGNQNKVKIDSAGPAYIIPK